MLLNKCEVCTGKTLVEFDKTNILPARTEQASSIKVLIIMALFQIFC